MTTVETVIGCAWILAALGWSLWLHGRGKPAREAMDQRLSERAAERDMLLLLYDLAMKREDPEMIRHVRLQAAVKGFDLRPFGVFRGNDPCSSTHPCGACRTRLTYGLAALPHGTTSVEIGAAKGRS